MATLIETATQAIENGTVNQLLDRFKLQKVLLDHTNPNLRYTRPLVNGSRSKGHVKINTMITHLNDRINQGKTSIEEVNGILTGTLKQDQVEEDDEKEERITTSTTNQDDTEQVETEKIETVLDYNPFNEETDQQQPRAIPNQQPNQHMTQGSSRLNNFEILNPNFQNLNFNDNFENNHSLPINHQAGQGLLPVNNQTRPQPQTFQQQNYRQQNFQHPNYQNQNINKNQYNRHFNNQPTEFNARAFNNLTFRKLHYEGLMEDYQSKCARIVERGRILVSINENWATEIKNQYNIEIKPDLNGEEYNTLYEAILHKLQVANPDPTTRGTIYSLKLTNNKWFLTIKNRTKEIAKNCIRNRKNLKGFGSCNWLFPGPKPIKTALDVLVHRKIILGWHLSANTAQIVLSATKGTQRLFFQIKSFADVSSILANINSMQQFVQYGEWKTDLVHSSENNIEEYNDNYIAIRQ